MKYSININQLVLANSSLDLIDCAILDWLIMFCNSKNKKITDKKDGGATWISYQKLIDDMPLLRIKTKSGISKRIKRIEHAGFISCELKNGDKMYVELTEKIDTLFIQTVSESERYRFQEETPTVSHRKPIIILNNNNTNINKDSDISISIFEHWNSKNIIVHKVLNDDIKKSIKYALKNYSLDEILKAIDVFGVILSDSNKYWWTHKWGLSLFLKKGLARFVGSEASDYQKEHSKVTAMTLDLTTKK